MQGPIIANLLLAALAAGLIYSAATDLRHRLIYNRVTAAIALAAPLYWLALGEPVWPHMALHIATGLGIFILFALFFALGAMGGGDVKLISALALWFPLPAVIQLLLYTSIIGLIVTILFWIDHRRRQRSGRVRVPYGIAISLAALWIIGEPYFNQFA